MGSPPSISQCGVAAWLMPASQRRQAYLGRIVTPLAHENMRCRAADDMEPGWNNIQPLGTILTDLDHVGAAAEADLVLRLDHHFDAEAGWSGRWPRLRLAEGRLTVPSALRATLASVAASASATAVSRSSKASWRASGFSCSDFFP